MVNSMDNAELNQRGVTPHLIRVGMWFATTFAVAFPIMLVLMLLSVLPSTIGGEPVELVEWLRVSAPLYALASGLLAAVAYAIHKGKRWSRELVVMLWIAVLAYNAVTGLMGAVPKFEAWRAIGFCVILGTSSIWYFYFKSSVVAYYDGLAKRQTANGEG